jgi:GH141 insertion domain
VRSGTSVRMQTRFVLGVLFGILWSLSSSATARDIELKPDQPLTAAAIGDAKRIVLRGGTYFMPEPLVLTPANSKITIEAYAGEQPILSGGRRIENWRKEKFNGRDAFVADVPGVQEGKTFFRQLWINDTRAIRARQPNGGALFHVKESPDATDNWEIGQSRFRFDGNDVPAGEFS